MAKSRYSDTQILENHYKTFSLPKKSLGYAQQNFLENVKTQDYTIIAKERLDHISFKFFGDEQYWWVLAVVNNINYPFASGGLIPGKTIKIPLELQKVLDRLMR